MHVRAFADVDVSGAWATGGNRILQTKSVKEISSAFYHCMWRCWYLSEGYQAIPFHLDLYWNAL